MSVHSGSPFLWREPGREPRVRLFCFPYAGGGASIFRHWLVDLPRDIEVLPVQMPGHESRLKEPLFSDLEPLVEDLRRDLAPHFDVPFALFGHSMGALIAFELARRLVGDGSTGPVHLFVSGRRAPHVADADEGRHRLTDAELVEEVRGLNGSPAGVLQDPELMELLLPVLRADFAICERYEYRSGAPLRCGISVFSGTEDPEVRPEDVVAWREHTLGTFEVRMFPGDHFFLHGARRPLLEAIAEDLTSLRRAAR